MGHSAFDLEKMEQAARWALDDGEEGGERGARGPDAATTPDGLTITSSVAVGWGVRRVGKRSILCCAEEALGINLWLLY